MKLNNVWVRNSFFTHSFQDFILILNYIKISKALFIYNLLNSDKLAKFTLSATFYFDSLSIAETTNPKEPAPKFYKNQQQSVNLYSIDESKLSMNVIDSIWVVLNYFFIYLINLISQYDFSIYSLACTEGFKFTLSAPPDEIIELLPI